MKNDSVPYHRWKKIQIGSFLTERENRYKPDDKKIQNLQRLGKIDFSGTIHVSSKPTKTDMIIVYPGDLVISGINAAKGAISVWEGEQPITATIHYTAYIFDKEVIDIDFFKRFVKSPAFIRTLQEQVKGGIKTEIKAKTLLPLQVNIPSLPEQRQINKHFESFETELSQLCDEFSVQSLLVVKLRKTILQEAIEGKLTADWRKENPVCSGDPEHDGAALLAKIKAQKRKMIEQGKIRKEKPLAPVKPEEIPFALPEGWVWTRLGEVAQIGTGATPLTSNSQYWKNGTVNWITSSATNYPYVQQPDKLITERALSETNCKVYPEGTLILAMYGQGKTRGQISELLIPTATNQALAVIQLYVNKEETRGFIKTFFIKQYNDIRALASGGAQPNLNLSKIANTFIPLPPLAEQRTIVERIDKLFAMVDSLETQVKERKAQVEGLMQAVLRGAFEEYSIIMKV